MKKRRFYIGPGAPSLLLAVVVVGLSVLGLLALMSARGDARIAERSLEFAVAEHMAMAEAEKTLSELDALLAECAVGAADDTAYLAAVEKALPEGMEMQDRTVAWTQASGASRELWCAVEIAPLGGEMPRCAWTEHTFLAAFE